MSFLPVYSAENNNTEVQYTGLHRHRYMLVKDTENIPRPVNNQKSAHQRLNKIMKLNISLP